MTIDSVTHLFLGLVLLAFAWVFLDFLFVRLGDRFARYRAARKIRECHLCGRRYPEKPSVRLSQCPECDATNHRKGHHRLG
ncbi:MAG: hypothetical protein ACSHYF_04995 [Verrucomicrobiaceae bacterium]